MHVSSSAIDSLVENAVFGGDDVKEESRRKIQALALSEGAFPASIQGLYEAAGKGKYTGITVPAMNIRGITYQAARAVFRAALKGKVGAFIFELARSEMGYTRQSPGEYAVSVLAAAVKEGFRGPVFIQGDHYQVNRKRYATGMREELNAIEGLIRESIAAGFLNIDIDASTLVDLDKPDLGEQQARNFAVTAHLTEVIRRLQPDGVTVSIGGEIGEVGKRNSTVEELRAFMNGYRDRLPRGIAGISKISVQTGTTHGGVVLPDGSIAAVQIDFDTLKKLSHVAREEYGLAGAVQHGASTLPEQAFHLFPQAGTAEVHLATGFQNAVYDNAHFPPELLQEIYRQMSEKYAGERADGETDEQFHYRNRKRSFGDFKRQLWDLPRQSMDPIMEDLESRFRFIFKCLNVLDTVDLVNTYVSRPVRRD